tara:strand:- start:1692 stop:2048 length:357 start_codon:yes stop_codon:yes gene_type:complete
METFVVASQMAAELKKSRESGNDLADLVRKLSAKIDAQNEEISKLLGQSEANAMHIAGLEAARAAYMKQHNDSPLLRDSGKRFKDGDAKTNARLIYERAFDEKGRQIGISNPVARRVD